MNRGALVFLLLYSFSVSMAIAVANIGRTPAPKLAVPDCHVTYTASSKGTYTVRLDAARSDTACAVRIPRGVR